MLTFDTKDILYEEQPGDKFWYPVSDGNGFPHPTTQPINLNAITYYAMLSMKPLRIGHLVGCSHTAIFNISPLRRAYEKGAAYHEVKIRTIAMENSGLHPMLAYEMLNRSVGKAEDDVLAGRPPEALVAEAPVWTVEAPIFNDSGNLTASEKAELNGDEQDYGD